MRTRYPHSPPRSEKRAQRLLLIIALLFPWPVFSQLHNPFNSEKFQFNKIEQVKGLENTSVTTIVQDDYGFIWFGTFAGLIRFDGHEIRQYKHDLKNSNSLASNTIHGLTKDRNGNLWIATQGGGLDRFEIATERFTHYRYSPNDPFSVSSNSLFSVMVDSRGMVWTGTFSSGLNMLDPKTDKFTHIEEDRYSPIRTIIEDKSGMIWFSSNGINRVDPNDFSLKKFPPESNEPFSDGEIRSIYQDKSGKFWIAIQNEQNVYHFDQKTEKYKAFSLYNEPVSIHTFCEDNIGRIWVATSEGIAIVDLEDDKISYHQTGFSDNNPLSKRVVLTTYSDTEGIIWMGIEGGGVSRVHPGKKFYTFPYYGTKGLDNRRLVRSLAEDDSGRIWMGWVKGGVDIFDPHTNILTDFNTDGFDNITCIYPDRDGSVWIGSWGNGVLHYSSVGKKIGEYKSAGGDQSLPDNRVQTILRDSRNILWIGTENGLSQFDEKLKVWKPVKKPYFPFDLFGNNIQSLAFRETPDGTLWAGTGRGLNRISPDRKSIQYYRFENQADTTLGCDVISLCQDHKNNVLWIGTFELGLLRLNLLTREITQITQKQGLPSNIIFGIEQDIDGYLWLSTSDGLTKYNPDTGHSRNFEAVDGLQGNEFFWGAALKTRNGKMLFGGASGLSMFDPSEITNNTNPIPVVVTELDLFNKPVVIGDKDSLLHKWLPETKEITLSYEQSVFTFEFAALDYARHEKNQYAYILENFDKGWNHVGNKRSATYTNIYPGEYTFRVKAFGADGVWIEAKNPIKLIITPPYWLTWWFKMLSAIFVIGTLLTFYFVRIGIANRQREALEQKVTQRTTEISAKNEEILAQMERVRQLGEEIAQQRDNIEVQNNMLASSKIELEKKVEERTNELSLSNKELMHQNVQLEQFAFMTAHNLRSPVARLLGLTAIFNNDNANDPLNKEVIKRVQKSALGLDEVIKDIADILQVQKGTKHRLESLQLYPAIQHALDVLNSEINEHKINIVNKIDQDTRVYGVPAYVNSIFYNIISNAVKYADLRKKPFIEIDSVQNNGKVSITFTDNGIGFDRDRLKDKLFKPFSRLNANGDGKGLGLYLVKIEMESMNGEVDIQSKVDKGTWVTLRFINAYDGLQKVRDQRSEIGTRESEGRNQ